ncbi:MAG TPA: hypothetical protein VK828_10085 [Terriglobales bacterium]|jgi:hypothetical protein|nr:hypothetical protein [Terriglobales bacterium]
MLSGRKLALTLVFTGLVAVGAGVSCKGFFVNPTLASITIQPATPSVQLTDTVTLQAYGVDNESPPVGSYLTSGVSWSSSDPTVAQITGACATAPCGTVSLQGVTIGTSTITASSESVTNTTTITVFISVSSMTISPTSQSLSTLGATTPDPFIVTVNGTTDVSSSATLTAYLNGTASPDINCTYSTSNPTGGAGGAGIYCAGDGSEGTGTYQLIATYTGTTITATATLNVQ